jgi:2-(1,2-epoxy-1,2-dihydrophenyl)acetyl-CoA isomerase
MQPQLVDHLLYEKEDNGICWIKFNRPDRMNAVFGTYEANGTVRKVVDYMRAADDDPDVRVIVLTGIGKAFCAGADLKSAAGEDEIGIPPPGARGIDRETPEGHRQHFIHGLTRTTCEISQIRKPTLAMVNGPAAGLGLDMALHCDIRLGCEKTRFLPYMGVGQIIENGGSYFLPRMVGIGRALEFAYVGHLAADRAYEWGLLNHLVNSDELEATTRKLCADIIAKPPLPQWISKRIMRAALDSSLETTMVMTSNASGILGLSEDGQEARRAFREKRQPDFKGR